MKLHEYANAKPQFRITLETDQLTGCPEAIVVANAMGLSGIQRDYLGISEKTAQQWAITSAWLRHTPETQQTITKRIGKDRLRQVGQALAGYALSTEYAMDLPSAFGGTAAGARRVEGAVAEEMANVIRAHIDIPEVTLVHGGFGEFTSWVPVATREVRR